MTKETYFDLNAEVKLLNEEGEPQLEKDKESVRQYFLEHVNQHMVFFHSLEEKVEHLTNEVGLWDREVVLRYGHDGLKKLMKIAYGKKFRFPTFMGANKFYNSYALKTPDGKRYYERYEDRVVLTAIQYSSNCHHAVSLVDHIIAGRFQPATPTFLNAGLADAGRPVSCFQLNVQDNMESISRSLTDALQLSKRGGGVGILMSNIREAGAPIKGREGQASGVIPVMKMYEDGFSYANQLGARQGAGAVYLNAHHPDILQFLDTKRENADEKIRIKTLSLGVVVPDITFDLAREQTADNRENMALFSPYDVERVYGKPFAEFSVTEMYSKWLEDSRIKKTFIDPRKLFQTIAQIQFESGYPYLFFEDAANRANPAPNVGRISFSNICSEISQPTQKSTYFPDGSFDTVGRDISCNLGSLNIAKMLELDEAEFEVTVNAAYQFLHNVASNTVIESSPAVIRGNDESLAIGLGQMNLHGALIKAGLEYDSDEARVLFDNYMEKVTFYMIQSSIEQASISGGFANWEDSRWGEIIASHIDYAKDNWSNLPWGDLLEDYLRYGIANQHLQAIPPTGSISYINHSTASIHPVTSPVEVRKEGKLGRVYYPQYGVTNENVESIKNAFQIGPEAVIDMYAVAGRWVDQGMSLTLFFPDTATTRDVNRAQLRAHKAGLKSLYYIRTAQKALEGTEVEGCLSCML